MSGPDPAVAAIRNAVAAELTDLPPSAPVLVACSGGPDSLALAAGAAFWARRVRRTRRRATEREVVGAVVVDQRWHPGSAAICAAAAHACAELGLDPVEVVEVPQGVEERAAAATQGGPEAAARAARYQALDDAAHRLGAGAVLLGHTQDDQAETVLMALARGSGARSLAGMPRRRGLYRRPLLGLRRELTRQACRALGLHPWDDPANSEPAYTRARLRSVMDTLEHALGPALVPSLARTAEQLREDAEVLEALAGDLLAAARLDYGAAGGEVDGEVALELDVDLLAAAPAALRRRALLAAIREAGCPPSAVGSRHVLAVDALLVAWRGQGPASLPGGIIATRACGRLALSRPRGGSAVTCKE